jgi:MFS family permease
VYYFGLATSLSLLVVLVTDELNGSAASFGLVLAVGAVGAFVGTLIGGPLAARVGPRISLSGAVALQATTLGAAAASSSVLALAALWFLNGIPAGAQRPIARSLQQRLTPNELLGRVNVTARILTRGIIVIGALVAGALATRSGVRASFVLGGLVQLFAAAMIWAALGRSDVASTDGGQDEG